MSNFIKHKDQNSRINLDLVTRYYSRGFSVDEYPLFAICFEYSGITNDSIQEARWYFATEEERDTTLKNIDKLTKNFDFTNPAMSYDDILDATFDAYYN